MPPPPRFAELFDTAMAARAEGRHADAARLLGLCRALDGVDASWRAVTALQLGFLAERLPGGDGEAIRWFEEAVALAPTTEVSSRALCAARLRAGQVSAALTEAERFFAVRPGASADYARVLAGFIPVANPAEAARLAGVRARAADGG